MKNSHCCMCGAARGIAPIQQGITIDGIYTPSKFKPLDRNPAPGVHIEESPGLIISAHVYRNGGTSADVHVCPDCLTRALTELRDRVTRALGT